MRPEAGSNNFPPFTTRGGADCAALPSSVGPQQKQIVSKPIRQNQRLRRWQNAMVPPGHNTIICLSRGNVPPLILCCQGYSRVIYEWYAKFSSSVGEVAQGDAG